MPARLPLVFAALFSSLAFAESTACPPTPIYSRCELVFELNDTEAKVHPKPFESIDMHAEFRSPEHHKTSVVPAFWDGGRRLVIRFAPDEVGEWQYRVTSNVERWTDKEYKFTATTADVPGFIAKANIHHWWTTANKKPHLWMGDTILAIAAMPADQFRREVDNRAQQKFTHIRGILGGDPSKSENDFRAMDERIAYMNSKGIVFDAILSGADRQPDPSRYLQYIVARYGAYNITWEVAEHFEDLPNGRDTAKSLGLLLKRFDPYNHPRSSGAHVTSTPLLADGWSDHATYGTTDEQIGSIEHQLYTVPFVNAGVDGRDADDFRHQLWNTTMNGQYPTSSRSVNAGAMTVWYTFFDDTRHWELEPYYDVDGGRALALEGTEYIVYVEKPSGPIEVRMSEKHGFDVAWFNPANGEFIKLKNWKGDRFAAEPPDTKHDWVLYLSREGRKESMLNSWKFESRPIPIQDVDQNNARIPFAIAQPSKDDVSVSHPPKYEITLKRQSRGTRWMYYVWTGEVVTTGQGFRVIGTGAEGTLKIPASFGAKFPAVMNVHLVGMNAIGTVYSLDRIYTLSQ